MAGRRAEYDPLAGRAWRAESEETREQGAHVAADEVLLGNAESAVDPSSPHLLHDRDRDAQDRGPGIEKCASAHQDICRSPGVHPRDGVQVRAPDRSLDVGDGSSRWQLRGREPGFELYVGQRRDGGDRGAALGQLPQQRQSADVFGTVPARPTCRALRNDRSVSAFPRPNGLRGHARPSRCDPHRVASLRREEAAGVGHRLNVDKTYRQYLFRRDTQAKRTDRAVIKIFNPYRHPGASTPHGQRQVNTEISVHGSSRSIRCPGRVRVR